jgi:hypothetical protein
MGPCSQLRATSTTSRLMPVLTPVSRKQALSIGGLGS